jgi:hypothetical protein
MGQIRENQNLPDADDGLATVNFHGCQSLTVRYNYPSLMTIHPAISTSIVSWAIVSLLLMPINPHPLPFLSSAAPVAAGSLIEIAELLAHPELYDHQDVVVMGKVMNVQLATNRQGQPAYGFLLQGQAGTLKVVSLGQLEVHEGDQVIVEGIFNRLRQVGRAIVYNEIKAISVQPLTRLNPDLVG